MASSNKIGGPQKIYKTWRIMGEHLDSYTKPGGFYPVHLGDVLNGRYLVFRKLGTGSQSTVWLARDKIAPDRRFVAVKVFEAKSSQNEIELDKLKLQQHPGEQHVELALDSFIVHGPHGNHFCKVLEPLGGSLSNVLENAFDCRSKLNAPEQWRQRVLDGDPWSENLAKHACYQILLGLDYLHSQKIAHRDVQPSNVCVALEYDISSPSENEIQRAVWPAEKKEQTELGDAGITSVTNESSSDSDTDSDDSWEEWHTERKRALDEKWQVFEHGNKLAEPHSVEWNKANFLNSREHIELLERVDGKPIQPDEIQYTPLFLGPALNLSKSSRLVLIDLGFACTFEECEKQSLYTQPDYRPPEDLLGLSVTHKADIFSAGLSCWEIVMLRPLVETRYFGSDDQGRVDSKNRQLHDFIQRIGPLPSSMQAQWTDAEKFLDSEGIALENQGWDDGEIYGPDDFEYGDIWHQEKHRKPNDMSDTGLELFISLIQEMLQFKAEVRLSTSKLLQHKWFADMK